MALYINPHLLNTDDSPFDKPSYEDTWLELDPDGFEIADLEIETLPAELMFSMNWQVNESSDTIGSPHEEPTPYYITTTEVFNHVAGTDNLDPSTAIDTTNWELFEPELSSDLESSAERLDAFEQSNAEQIHHNLLTSVTSQETHIHPETEQVIRIDFNPNLADEDGTHVHSETGIYALAPQAKSEQTSEVLDAIVIKDDNEQFSNNHSAEKIYEETPMSTEDIAAMFAEWNDVGGREHVAMSQLEINEMFNEWDTAGGRGNMSPTALELNELTEAYAEPSLSYV